MLLLLLSSNDMKIDRLNWTDGWFATTKRLPAFVATCSWQSMHELARGAGAEGFAR